MKLSNIFNKFIISICVITVLFASSASVKVFAGESASVVMTYKSTTYTKVLYDIEVQMIKDGLTPNGLLYIGEMCDNVAVLTGGEATVDKTAVMNTVKNMILTGNMSINIDLSKYLKSSSTTTSPIVLPDMASLTDTLPSLTTDLTTTQEEAALPALSNAPASSGKAAIDVPAKPNSYSIAMNNYYKQSVFIGDSIMVGFRNYSMKAKDSFLNNAKFLASGSYSLRNALRQQSDLHPTYKGAKRPVWESIKMMDVDRVFIMFGMNDISIVGVDKSCENYTELINKIKKESPNVEINIISMTNVVAGYEGKRLTNASVDEFNTKLRVLCAQNNWGFCELSQYLVDENGALLPQYCSDGFVHMTHKAYEQVWEPVFYNYAVSKGVK